MVQIKLGKRDKELLRELQKNCKQSMRKLSRKVDLPITTMHRRIKRMEKAGVIKGYTAVVDAKKINKPVTAFMLATVKYRMNVDKIAEELMKIPGIQEVHYLIGEWDLMLKLRVSTLDDYYNFSARTVLQMPGITNTSGIIAPKTFKETCAIEV
jgi:DNA-binding Lrp family transcriptional regulator